MIKLKMVGAVSSDLEGAVCSGQVGALSSDLEGAVWLKFPVDPETSLTGAGSNLQGFDYFNNPGTKSLFLGVKLGF